MKKEKVLEQEQKSKLQPFPFIENERYLLKLKDDKYVIAYWENGQFASDYDDNFVEKDIESIIALKDLGL